MGLNISLAGLVSKMLRAVISLQSSYDTIYFTSIPVDLFISQIQLQLVA